jgi:hypothetical protein
MNEAQIVEAVARVLFPLAEWQSPNLAWVQCPGIEQHSTSNGKKDCRLTINDGLPPTLYCCHDSCAGMIADWNYKMRSEIGKMKITAGNVLRKGKMTVSAPPMVAPRPAPAVKAVKPLEPLAIPATILDGQRIHLETCFAPDELVAIVFGKGPDGKPKDKGITREPIPLCDNHEFGTYIRVNPMKAGGSGDADVTAWRHCLIEGDKAPMELQWAAIVASGLPVSVVISSGGRSIHAWVRVDAATPEEFRIRAKMAADAMEEYEGIVLDRSCLNCSRLARLAGRQRGDKWQDLLAVRIGAACWDDWVASRKETETPAIEAQAVDVSQMHTEPMIQFYYRKAKKDFIMVRGRVITPITESGLKMAFRQEGLAFDREQIEAEVYKVMTEHAIDYDGSMPGYPIGLHEEGGRRYYCDAGPTWFQGIPPTSPEIGAGWSTIHKLTMQLFSPRIEGEEPTESKAWWRWAYAIKMSREALKLAISNLQNGQRRQVRPGQAMVLCGPKNCGKSFLVNQIIRPLLGGRQQDAHKAFANGAEAFNGELLHGEVWTVDDKEHSHRIDQRRQFGASIKSMMYSGRVGFHAKHKEQVTLQPWARLFILCNDQDDAIRVLPPLTPDIEDKIHLFRCYYAPTPMPTDTGAQWSAYEEQIHAELPAFAGWLDAETLPEHAKDQRNGSVCWHDPYIVSLLSIQSPEHQLAQLLTHCIDRNIIPTSTPLVAMAILDAMREDESTRATARNLVHDDPAVLGRYLGRIVADAQRYKRNMGLDLTTAGKRRGAVMYQLRLIPENSEEVRQ